LSFLKRLPCPSLSSYAILSLNFVFYKS